MSVLATKLSELGRIRIGDRGGRNQAPRKLEAFRLTSTNKPRLHFATELWGGEVSAWPEAPEGKQWQAYLETAELPVVVPPFNSFSQHDEAWQGGVCVYRCDGARILFAAEDTLMWTPCACGFLRQPLPEDWQPQTGLQQALTRLHTRELTIDTVSRVNLLLPDVPGVGVWRFDTNSYYAGMELQGNADLLEQASAEGCYIACTLQLETRKVRRFNAKGKPETRVFPVVTLQPNVSMRQLLTREIPPEQLLSGYVRPTPQLREADKTPERHMADVYGEDVLPAENATENALDASGATNDPQGDAHHDPTPAQGPSRGTQDAKTWHQVAEQMGQVLRDAGFDHGRTTAWLKETYEVAGTRDLTVAHMQQVMAHVQDAPTEGGMPEPVRAYLRGETDSKPLAPFQPDAPAEKETLL